MRPWCWGILCLAKDLGFRVYIRFTAPNSGSRIVDLGLKV